MSPTLTKCGSCDESEAQHEWSRGAGCIDGFWYGHCSDPACGGLCDDLGRCPCQCHAAAEPESETP